ncbi:MAG: zinc ABC transporter solute-binding protein [Desulfobulbaceae bacterium]|nr:zinc ABC transporter solute-binding protein [Desulfobulbaceae bacterium]
MLVMCVSAAGLALPHRVVAAEVQPIKVLVSTFPIYQFTRNITAGSKLLQVDLMIPAQLGCPHDYALTPQDMQKLGEAQIFIINGLGMEEFLGAPLKQANPNLQLIDSSKGIEDILNYEGEEASEEAHAHHDGHNHNHDHDGHAEEAHTPHSHGSGPNPHIFASPRMAALQAGNIAKALAEVVPAEKELFTRNALAYQQKLAELDSEFQQLGKKLANTRIVTQHGVFDYLARDTSLEIVAVIATVPGQDPSAAEALNLVRIIREKKAGAIFTEPQYPDSIGNTVARESGVQLAMLDPVANGPRGLTPLDYYETIMRTNLRTLAETLGTK